MGSSESMRNQQSLTRWETSNWAKHGSFAAPKRQRRAGDSASSATFDTIEEEVEREMPPGNSQLAALVPLPDPVVAADAPPDIADDQAARWMHDLIQPAGFGSCWCGLSEWSCRPGLHSRGAGGLEEHFQKTASIQEHFPATLRNAKRSFKQMVEGSTYVLAAKKFAELDFPPVTRAILLRLRCHLGHRTKEDAADTLAATMTEFELLAEAIPECLGAETYKRMRLLAYTDAALFLAGDPYKPQSKEVFRAVQMNILAMMLELHMDDEALQHWDAALKAKDRGAELQSFFWTKARLKKGQTGEELGAMALQAALSSIATGILPPLQDLAAVVEACCKAATPCPWHAATVLALLSDEFRSNFPLQRLCTRFLSEMTDRCSSPETVGVELRPAISSFGSWVSKWLSAQAPWLFSAGAGITELRSLLPQRIRHPRLPGMEATHCALNLQCQLDACAYCIERDPMERDAWCLLSQVLCDLQGNQRCEIHPAVAKVWDPRRCYQWSRLFFRVPAPPMLSAVPDSAAPALLLLMAHLPKATLSDVTALGERWLECRGEDEHGEPLGPVVGKPGFLEEVPPDIVLARLSSGLGMPLADLEESLQGDVENLLTERSLKPQASAVRGVAGGGEEDEEDDVAAMATAAPGSAGQHRHFAPAAPGTAQSARSVRSAGSAEGHVPSHFGTGIGIGHASDDEGSGSDDNVNDDESNEDDDNGDEHDEGVPIFG